MEDIQFSMNRFVINFGACGGSLYWMYPLSSLEQFTSCGSHLWKCAVLAFFLFKLKCVLTYKIKQNMATIIKLTYVASRHANANAYLIIHKH